jgi:hypothetical protein
VGPPFCVISREIIGSPPAIVRTRARITSAPRAQLCHFRQGARNEHS